MIGVAGVDAVDVGDIVRDIVGDIVGDILGDWVVDMIGNAMLIGILCGSWSVVVWKERFGNTVPFVVLCSTLVLQLAVVLTCNCSSLHLSIHFRKRF